VSLVAVLDADKEGFLRSSGSLIQTVGRAARHVNGRAVFYADRMTDSMTRCIDETNRRREVQVAYNEAHGITPTSVRRAIDEGMGGVEEHDYLTVPVERDPRAAFRSESELYAHIATLEAEMRAAAANLEFEKAATLRDRIKVLRQPGLALAGVGAPGA
jgi:excinuclease ABC subunit B